MDANKNSEISIEKNNYTIFKKDYYNLFTFYGHSIDTIGHILQSLGYNLFNMYSNKAKYHALLTIYQLLENRIIEISYLKNMPFKKINLTPKEKVFEIEKIWPNDSSIVDFEFIVNFKYQDWYLKKIKESGININTDWDWFSTVFVPNMDKWIKNEFN